MTQSRTRPSVATGIGAPVRRVEDERLLTGHGRYADDLAVRGTPFTLEHGVLRPDPERTLQVPFEFVASPG